MTAKEILDKHYQSKMHWKSVNRGNVLKAMEEYAAQKIDWEKIREEFNDTYHGVVADEIFNFIKSKIHKP